jgi:hypothetical protein
MRKLSLLMMVALFLPGPLWGQRMSASISGTVTDPSGGVIPSARVTATNAGNGAVTTVETNAEGFYEIRNLEPGSYRVTVEMTGFQSYEQTEITLQAGQPRTINVSLILGSEATKITVSSEAPLVNTRDQAISTAITQLPATASEWSKHPRVSLAPDVAVNSPASSSNQQFTARRWHGGFQQLWTIRPPTI